MDTAENTPHVIPFGARVEVIAFPGAKPLRGTCRGREFGDPNAPGKHFVQVDVSRGLGCFWNVRALTDDEVAAERRALDAAINLID